MVGFIPCSLERLETRGTSPSQLGVCRIEFIRDPRGEVLFPPREGSVGAMAPMTALEAEGHVRSSCVLTVQASQ